MTKIEIELPDATVRAAREAGLLTSEMLDRILSEALQRQRSADPILSLVDKVEAAGIEPMSMEEITAEVKAYRAERRQKHASNG